MTKVLYVLLLFLITQYKLLGQDTAAISFANDKRIIDSIILVLEANSNFSRKFISGNSSLGEFRGYFDYSKDRKEIVKAEYSYAADSVGQMIFYYDRSNLVKFAGKELMFYVIDGLYFAENGTPIDRITIRNILEFEKNFQSINISFIE